MKDEMESPHPDNSDAHNEWLENRINKELETDLLKDLDKPKGSFSAFEKHLKKLKKD